MPYSLRPAAAALFPLGLALAGPAAAVVTFGGSSAFIQTNTVSLTDGGGEDADNGEVTDEASFDRTVESVAGSPGRQSRVKVKLHGTFSPALVTITGDWEIAHEVGSLGESGAMFSQAEAEFGMGFCTTEPLSFRLSGSASVEGSSETFRSRSADPGDDPQAYSEVEVELVDETVVLAGIQIEVDDEPRPITVASDSGALQGELEAGCETELIRGRLSARHSTPARQDVAGSAIQPPETRGRFRIDVTLSATSPDEGHRFRWVGPAQGAFADGDNWADESGNPGVPSFLDFENADVAVVDASGVVTIDLAASAAASRTLVPRGPVERRQGRLAVARTSSLEPINGTWVLDNLGLDLRGTAQTLDGRSLEVGGGGTLTLDRGVVRARHVAIGSGGEGTLTVKGPVGGFSTLGRFGVGADAEGHVDITNGALVSTAEAVLGEEDGQGSVRIAGAGSLWDTGSIAVGLEDAAALSIEGGAEVSSVEGAVDFQSHLTSDERATVVVKGKDGATPSTWALTGNLDIGSRGKVEVREGGALEALVVRVGTGGSEASCLLSRACLDVDDGTVTPVVIAVPGTSAGALRIGPRGRVTSNAVLIGIATDSRGEVTVTGPSDAEQLIASAGMSIGSESTLNGIRNRGTLVVEKGAKVSSSDSVAIGTVGQSLSGVLELRGDPGAPDATRFRVAGIDSDLILGAMSAEPAEQLVAATGEILLANGLVQLEDADLEIHRRGRISGSGRVFGFGVSFVTNDGVVGCGVRIQANYFQGAQGTLECPQANPPGVPQLSPLAASRFARALRVRPAPPPPPTGPFVVEGDATLGGRLVLQFLNGFAPRTDDSFELLDVSGTVTGAFASVEVRGLVPGSNFAEDPAGGKLRLTWLSDAEALPTVSVKAKPALKETQKKGGKVKFTRRGGDLSQALLVAYRVGGTARNGFDYAELPGVVEIPARKKSAKLVLRPYRDGAEEGPETIEIEVLPGESYTPSLFSKVQTVLESEVPKKKKGSR